MKTKKKISDKKIETLIYLIDEFVTIFEQEWVSQLPTPLHDKVELMNGWTKPEGFTDAMSVFFTGMCYKAQDRAKDKLINKIKAISYL